MVLNLPGFAGLFAAGRAPFRGPGVLLFCKPDYSPRTAVPATSELRGVCTSSSRRIRLANSRQRQSEPRRHDLPRGRVRVHRRQRHDRRRRRRATTRRTSRCSRAWRRSASARACTSARPASWACTTSCTRSWTTPWTRPSRVTARGVGHDPPRQLGDRHRQRSRDPGRDAREGGPPRGRGRADRAALRRQVRRRRRLQGLRRPARRRRVGRQRAVRAPGRGDPPRRVCHGRRSTRAAPRRPSWPGARSSPPAQRTGHDRHLAPGRRHLRDARASTSTRSKSACARPPFSRAASRSRSSTSAARATPPRSSTRAVSRTSCPI